ncbi:hypothetical protein V6V47_29235 [Micromonospora sp. CPCC 205539]|uniref:hypothetical protein n=1 Tax=Micromonospora sp. CPCC 205539 TaxID=3122408 RepID=UPI002FF284EA
MTEATADPTEAPAREARRVQSSTGHIRALVGVQLYVVAAYLAAAVIPYLWAPRSYPPTWTWIVPGWLLGVPGFFITLLGPVPGILLALIGGKVLVSARRHCPAGLYRWCVAGTVLAAAYGVFACTPVGRTIAAFVAD